MGRRWRVYHPGAGQEAGSVVRLDRQESHHVKKVLRLDEGDPIAIFDGRGNEWEALLLPAEGSSVRVRLESKMVEPVEADLPVTLYQGLCRPDRIAWVVQKATEIGVARIVVVAAQGEKPRGRAEERWVRIAAEACKQSGRRSLPELSVVTGLPEPGEDDCAILLAQHGVTCPIHQVLAEGAPRAVWIAVGPEGGFANEALERWADRGWRCSSLGPRTLRTETAGVVAAALVLHRWSDLGGPAGGAV